MSVLSEMKSKILSLNFNDKIYENIDLSPQEQIHERGKPRKYIELACQLFSAIGGETIVEVGCMRTKLTHPIEEMHPECCNEGHSTYLWSMTGANVYSVDISWKSARKARRYCREFKNCKIFRGDGIKFLEKFKKKIDLLYLDAWDVVPNTDYAENHLVAYLKAKDKLKETNVICIDDTDVGRGGKGRLLIPVLIADGYQILIRGRQTIALKEHS